MTHIAARSSAAEVAVAGQAGAPGPIHFTYIAVIEMFSVCVNVPVTVVVTVVHQPL